MYCFLFTSVVYTSEPNKKKVLSGHVRSVFSAEAARSGPGTSYVFAIMLGQVRLYLFITSVECHHGVGSSHFHVGHLVLVVLTNCFVVKLYQSQLCM